MMNPPRETSVPARHVRQLARQRRRARRAGSPVAMGANDWERALDYFEGCCAACGHPLYGSGDEAAAATIDHWIPLSKGGSTMPENIVPLCERCNNAKSDHLPLDWLTGYFEPSRALAISAIVEAYFSSIQMR